MRLSRRFRALAWESLGWSVAAGLALALAVSVALGLATERRLRAELAASRASQASTIRTLAVCEATSATFKNALAVAGAGAGDSAQASGARLSPEQLLTRRAAGADACARAFEAEALVREATR